MSPAPHCDARVGGQRTNPRLEAATLGGPGLTQPQGGGWRDGAQERVALGEERCRESGAGVGGLSQSGKRWAQGSRGPAPITVQLPPETPTQLGGTAASMLGAHPARLTNSG